MIFIYLTSFHYVTVRLTFIYFLPPSHFHLVFPSKSHFIDSQALQEGAVKCRAAIKIHFTVYIKIEFLKIPNRDVIILMYFDQKYC